MNLNGEKQEVFDLGIKLYEFYAAEELKIQIHFLLQQG